MRKWNYCSNAVTDQIWKTFSHDKFMLMDRDHIGALPEFLSKLDEGKISLRQLFQDFYLQKGNAETQVLDKTKGIVLLHNSRMPKHYRNMDAEEFLRQDIMLADLLKKVLN